MKIPAKVVILDRNYDVIFDSTIGVEKDCAGEIRYRTQEIRLMPSCEGDPRTAESIEYSFFHELIHGILHAIHYEELREDEQFVSRLARVLYHSLRESKLLIED